MTRMAFMAAGLTMLSCSSSSKEGAGDSGSGSDDGGCNVENVAVVYPASDGATDFYYRGSVEFALDNADDVLDRRVGLLRVLACSMLRAFGLLHEMHWKPSSVE